MVLATNNIKVEWVAIEGSGKNALDFHIAYFLGKKDLEADTLHFILSKDTGYDPLIAFINKKAKQEIAKRIISLEDLKQQNVNNKPCEENPDYKTLLNFLNSFAKVRRPKSEAKLESFIKTQIFTKKSESEIRKLIEELYRNKVNSKGVNNRISYK